jgi:hypothetical protein
MAPSPPRVAQGPGAPLERPRLSIGRSRVADTGPSLGLAPHRNAAATVAIAISAPSRLGLGRARIGADASTDPVVMNDRAPMPAMMCSEGGLTGGTMIILSMYRPRWAATFDDAFHLRRDGCRPGPSCCWHCGPMRKCGPSRR